MLLCLHCSISSSIWRNQSPLCDSIAAGPRWAEGPVEEQGTLYRGCILSRNGLLYHLVIESDHSCRDRERLKVDVACELKMIAAGSRYGPH